MFGRRRRLGLRARVTVIYALGALLMAALVAVSTFTLTQARLLDQAETAAREQAYENAMDLRRRLQSVPTELLAAATGPSSDTFTSDIATSDTAVTDDPETAASATAAQTATSPTTSPQPTSAEVTTAQVTTGPAPDTALTTIEPAATSSTSEPSFAVDLDEVRRALGITSSTTPAGPRSTGATATEPSATQPPAPEAGPIEPSDAIAPLLGALRYPAGVGSLLFYERDRSLSGLRKSDLPNGLRFLVERNNGASQRFSQNGRPMYAVGVPIINVGSTGETAQYYEVTSLDDLQSTLNLLQVILGGTALAASLAGAGLGYYSARRALQPLVDVSAAAQSIAQGDFDTRLDSQVDPDLAGLASSFNEMVDALRIRIERDSRFASDVSHELRSPLMTLAASVGVLEGRRDDLPVPAQQAVDLLGQEVRRFEQLVSDLLEISRMDVGAAQLERDPILLAEFLQFVVARSQSPDVPIAHPTEESYLVVMVDKRRLAQSVSNLLDNAAKYAAGATEVGFVRPSPTQTMADDLPDVAGGWVYIYVEDRGGGVALADRERIFDRFTRASGDAGRREVATGVGLGLSLVGEHTRLHNGRVWVTDRPDGTAGARFVIAIPIGDDVEFDEERAL